MPRQARLLLPDFPLHVIQRGNNRQTCFHVEGDYLAYLAWVGEHARRTFCQVHAYVLMTNHIHLLVSSGIVDGVPELMKAVGQRYTNHFNRRYHRSGSLWQGRYKSCVVQDETYLLLCQRYIEMNPVRAGLVAEPVQYRWSSYRGNAEGRTDSILCQHALYQRLGAGPQERQLAYRGLFQDVLKQKHIDRLRLATNSDFAVGNDAFLRMARGATTNGSDPRV